jgi:hypothetical protein
LGGGFPEVILNLPDPGLAVGTLETMEDGPRHREDPEDSTPLLLGKCSASLCGKADDTIQDVERGSRGLGGRAVGHSGALGPGCTLEDEIAEQPGDPQLTAAAFQD